jgi:hypothetical protein
MLGWSIYAPKHKKNFQFLTNRTVQAFLRLALGRWLEAVVSFGLSIALQARHRIGWVPFFLK